MSIPLDQPSSSATVRKPGDFRRRGTDGPPIVSSLTKTRQPTGKKAELQAKARAKGIDPGTMTVPQLKEAIGGEPADETYGRPSGFGDPLENSYALRKHIERGIAAGVVKLVVGLELDPMEVDLDDPDALDQLVVDAQDAVASMIWAERGTHVHSLIERHETGQTWKDLIPAGERLGLPEALQRAIVAEWARFRAGLGARSQHCELPVVNDASRIAGTLDLLDVFDRALELTIGEATYTVEPGQPVVGDVKTGDPRDKYAVQISGYADAVPYDTTNEERLDWPHGRPHPNVGLIYHMPMKAVLDGAPVTWSAIPVDLAVGREGARICCEARDWPATPVFGQPFAVTSSAGGDDEAATSPSQPDVKPGSAGRTASPAPSNQVAAVQQPQPGDEEAAAPSSSSPTNRRDALRARKVAMETDAIQTGWHPRFLAEWAAHGITADSTDDEIEAALNAIEPPFDPDPAPPHGIERPTAAPVTRPATVSPAEVARMLEAIAESDYRAVVNAWLAQANAARCSFDPRGNHLEVNHARTYAAYELARATDGDDEYARLILGHVLAGAAQPAVEVGVAIGHLSVEDARQAIALAKAFGDSVALIFAEDGSPRLDGPIAAVLAAA